jgi:hypothetical protein
MKTLVLSIFFILLSPASLASEITVYEMTVKGKSCKEQSGQQLSCQYKIGNDLHISLDGIGAPDTGITFMKSNFNGDFYATYGVGHGCVIVKSGYSENGGKLYQGYSFISPKNGKVYKNWKECQSGY